MRDLAFFRGDILSLGNITHSLCNRQVKHISVEHLLFFGIRNELQFLKVRKAISLEFPQFAKLTQVKLSCRNTIFYGCYDKCPSVKNS